MKLLWKWHVVLQKKKVFYQEFLLVPLFTLLFKKLKN
ncbi:Uncharacterised protein [Mycobacterium tuberculosis]|nr:Uncharacterised protein [Mycobacterium tuberculosis]